ncbi:hypothetical protein THIAE_01875 [Thiomicrospira aerophila AL3]|uniref:Methyl-accepting chemotaxis protein n=1 Tax=Thiomicrospira aerophila AL3 TaxID=717772 RepID=W0DUF4_9GAMM|nr:methyl-accepting chemotaxis protein [Thiomicrospira aerophila]AHF02185.1 hypothetical protein THIAE_01875 [Thiomicrospira aerophila AL3]
MPPLSNALNQIVGAADKQDRLKTDKLMLVILLAHFPVTAFLAPIGYDTQSFALIASGLLAGLVVAAYITLKGTRGFSLFVGAALMLNSAILIQAQMGRIEMHFHIFASLAFLLAYRDYLPVIVAAVVGAIHHITLTYLQLESVALMGMPVMIFNYGCSWDITALHIAFVLVEAGVLIYLGHLMRADFVSNALVSGSLNQIARTQQFSAPLASVTQRTTTIDALDKTMSQTSEALGEISQVMEALSKGDLSVRVKGEYHGDLAKIKQAVNQSADNLAVTFKDLNAAFSNLAAGEFKLDAQVALQEGEFGRLMSNTQHTVAQLQQTFSQMNGVMQAMAGGDFSSRLVMDAQGEFAALQTLINQSLENVANSIEMISEVIAAQATGDLVRDLPAGVFMGQLHDLKNSINYSRNQLRDVVDVSLENANYVSVIAHSVREGAYELRGQISEQVATIKHNNSLMSQMKQTLIANTEATTETDKIARQVRAKVEQGQEVMNQTIEEIQAIQQSSHKIADIVSLIDSIAFQTNLLALNAAVEAARAGEHGRGFAVVASEVRALAQKSADAAKDIGQLIGQSVSQIEQGTKLVAQSGATFGEISQAIEEVTLRIGSVADVSQSQRNDVEQVSELLMKLQHMLEASVEKVQQTDRNASDLNDKAKGLQVEVGFFRTPKNPTEETKQIANL